MLICPSDNTCTRFTAEQVMKVVWDTAVISFLTGIVSLYCIAEKNIISITQILMHKCNVVRCSETVDIFGSKCTVVVGQAALALTH